MKMDKISNQNHIDLQKEYERAKTILTASEYAALNNEIPMTQELYNSILDKIIHMIPSANELLFHILQQPQYDAFMISYAENIL